MSQISKEAKKKKQKITPDLRLDLGKYPIAGLLAFVHGVSGGKNFTEFYKLARTGNVVAFPGKNASKGLSELK